MKRPIPKKYGTTVAKALFALALLMFVFTALLFMGTNVDVINSWMD